jgi:hypothetical protein
MTQPLIREVRLLVLVAVLVAGYGAVVFAIASSVGQTDLLASRKINGSMVMIWMIAIVFAFFGYALNPTLRRRPGRIVDVVIEDARSHLLRADLLIARATTVSAWFVLMLFFTPLKIMMGHVQGFHWDEVLANIDRLVFLSYEPWQVTHLVFGTAPATFLLQLCYNFWFVLMWFGIIYFTLRPENVPLRARYLIGFILSWIVVGSAFAWLLASAGPCFFERAFGDPRFVPLMSRLHLIDAELVSTMPKFGIHALQLQDMLWESFSREKALFGGGISAAPSMHVSLAVLMACAGWQASRKLGWLLSIYAVIIWIGSIHLGWHYAVDGLIALPLTLAIWKLSGWLVERYVLGEQPVAFPQPVLAE